eukprot:TRINITY_DN6563_c0_g1_i2.p1 TRINITY_DN6563_c0_g1~~TRINITY_DN6563_c0_g1_i2.p1  ORF type:complete len:517 (+),score=80.13 TRINITY_DN6563_c0_g1_i2:55-1605(+)
MVFGIFTSSLPEHRKPVAYPLLEMTERQAVAVTTFIVQQRLDEIKAMREGNSVREAQHKRKKLTLEQKLEQLKKQEVGLKERIMELESEKHEAFNTFRELLAKEAALKREREIADAKAGKLQPATKVVQPVIRAPQQDQPELLRKSSLLGDVRAASKDTSPSVLNTPTNSTPSSAKRPVADTPVRTHQKPKLHAPPPPPRHSRPQSPDKRNTLPNTSTPGSDASSKQRRASRWEPEQSNNTNAQSNVMSVSSKPVNSEAIQTTPDTRSPLPLQPQSNDRSHAFTDQKIFSTQSHPQSMPQRPSTSNIAQAWSTKLSSPSLPGSAGPSSAGSNITEPQTNPTSGTNSPRRQSRFGPPVETPTLQRGSRLIGHIEDITPDRSQSGPPPPPSSHSPLPQQRRFSTGPSPGFRPRHPDSHPRQSRWGNSEGPPSSGREPPYSSRGGSGGPRPHGRGYPPNRDYRPPHPRDRDDGYRFGRDRPPFPGSDRRDEPRRPYGRGIPPSNRRGRGRGGYRGRGRR